MNSTITRRQFLTAASASVCLAGLSGWRCAAPKHANIIFFLIDDQRNDTLGCRHPIIKTPVIDRLVARGVRFENAFVTTSICAASRASIFTGLTERTHGYTFGKPPVPEKFASASYPALLRQAGYRTGLFGKYGVKMEAAPDTLFTDFAARDRPYLRDGRHIDEVNTERALEFLDDCGPDQPFCLSVNFSSAHAEDRDRTPGRKGHYPVISAAKTMYQDTEIPPPRLNDPAIFENMPDFLKKSLNRQRYFWRWDTPEKYQQNMRAYFAMLSGVDYMMGKILDKLEAQGRAENTVIIYAGDNGYYMGDRGFAGKWSHFEESLRVPLFIYDPRLPESKRGRTLPSMALNIDIPATILDLAGITPPAHYQGSSLAPWLRDKTVANWRTDFFCEHLMEHPALPKWEGVRDQRYVYARYFGQNPVYEFLHDLQEDPDQLTNFATDEKYQEILQQMRERCDALKNEYSQSGNVKNTEN